jgi:hypothetical protein
MFTGIRGGWLVEQYVLAFGKQKLHGRFLQLLNSTKQPRSSEDKLLLSKIWSAHKLSWMGWLVKGLKDISNKNNKQLFWLTLVLNNKGLSNSGQALASKLNFCLHPKCFQRLMAEETEREHTNNVHHLQNTSHVWWIDNYNKTYGQQFYKLNKGPQVVLNWTGFAVSLAEKFPKQLLLKPPARSILKPLLPTELYTNDNQRFLQQLVQTTTEENTQLASVLQTSFCHTHNITNIPLRPLTTGPLVSREDLQRLDRHEAGLKHFVPLQLLKENVGSNTGLAQVLVHLRSFYDLNNSKHFSVGKVDINIYWRLNLVHAHLSACSDYSGII